MWGEGISSRAFLIAAILLGSALAVPSPLSTCDEAEAAPNPIPVLTLGLYPTNLQATVTQSQLGSVTFGGNATVEKIQGIERVTVTLQAVVNTGWPVVVSPQTMVFLSPQTNRSRSASSCLPPPRPCSLATLSCRVRRRPRASPPWWPPPAAWSPWASSST